MDTAGAEQTEAVVPVRVYKDERLRDVIMKLVGKPVEVDGVLMAPCKGCNENLSVDKDSNIVWVRTHIGTLCSNTCCIFWKELMEGCLSVETIQWLRERYRDTWRPFFNFMLDYVPDDTTTPAANDQVVAQMFEELGTLRQKVWTVENDFANFKNELKLKELENAKNEAEKKWQVLEDNRKEVEKNEKANQEKVLDFQKKLEEAEKEKQKALETDKQSRDKLREVEAELQRAVMGKLEAEEKVKKALEKLLKAETDHQQAALGKLEAEQKEKQAVDKLVETEKDLKNEEKAKLTAEQKGKEARDKLEANQKKQVVAVTVIVAGIIFASVLMFLKKK